MEKAAVQLHPLALPLASQQPESPRPFPSSVGRQEERDVCDYVGTAQTLAARSVPAACLCVQPTSAPAHDGGRQLQRRGRERAGALHVRERGQTGPDDGAAGAGLGEGLGQEEKPEIRQHADRHPCHRQVLQDNIPWGIHSI